MKRFAAVLCAFLGLSLVAQTAKAQDISPGQAATENNSGPENGSTEAERVKRFWEDYYKALQQTYGSLQNIDWSKYYQGFQNNCYGSNGVSNNRIQFDPVFISPTMQWAVPNSNLNGPPANLGAAGMTPMMPH